ncbi:hypothetical protein JCM6294_1910 [Bacteroides pyogenes DSM 20611 = JCM 6294]|uniref:Uncharacterized protein n=1 Tax=Bacteroides pyogenes DSM 20611 = JCM 6294 TaxID=1121100 RepID=W4PGY8_9BACE|nr:hypothetical protein JCM6294_1910 [Bacteroides pyogenes DSM 20611 = JCM 6294]
MPAGLLCVGSSISRPLHEGETFVRGLGKKNFVGGKEKLLRCEIEASLLGNRSFVVEK